MNTKDDDLMKLRAAVETLIEHFDTVQIFASRHEPAEADGTIHCSWGAGNFYARYGQVQAFCIAQDAVFRAEELGNMGSDEEE